jgi:pentose-5-phosphate-3-epimerase
VAPSILSADFAAFATSPPPSARRADLIHVDVMDGHCPQHHDGPPVVRAIAHRHGP